MIGELLDRVIAPFAPAWARNRAIARAELRTYQAADRGRRNKDWSTTARSADAAIIPDATTINARARGMIRDSHVGKAIVRAKVRNIVGRGVTPIPVINAVDGSELTELNKLAEREFLRWANDAGRCDSEGRRTFWALQRLAIAETVAAGEAFFVLTYVPGSGPQLRAFESEQLDDTLRQHGVNEVRGGIEADPGGRAVAYHFWARNRNDLLPLRNMKSQRFEAVRVIHYFNPDRVMQARGISELAPVLQRIRDVHRRDEAELMKAFMEACHGVSITRNRGRQPGSSAGLPRAPGDGQANTPGDMPKFEYAPGMVFEGETGDEIKFHSPTTPGSSYEPYARANLRAIGAGVGLSYEQIARDFSLSNWSSQRQALLEDRREWNPEIDHLIDTLIAPVYEMWFRCAVMDGVFGVLLPFAQFAADPARFTEAEYVPDGHEWVDPEKELNAIEKGLTLDVLTRKEVIGRRGGRLRRTLEQRNAERKLGQTLGITFAEDKADGPAGAPGGAPGVPGSGPPGVGVSASGSPGTAADPNALVKDIATPEPAAVAAATDPTLNGAQIAAAVDVIGRLHDGQLAGPVALELLVSVGISRQKAEAMVGATTPTPPTPTTTPAPPGSGVPPATLGSQPSPGKHVASLAEHEIVRASDGRFGTVPGVHNGPQDKGGGSGAHKSGGDPLDDLFGDMPAKSPATDHLDLDTLLSDLAPPAGKAAKAAAITKAVTPKSLPKAEVKIEGDYDAGVKLTIGHINEHLGRSEDWGFTGEKLKESDLGPLSGAQAGAKVSVTVGDRVSLSVKADGVKIQERELYRDHHAGGVVCHNIELVVSKTGTGLGTRIFADQVAAARQTGIVRIETTAARSYEKGGYNGYSTWAKLGYDGKIPNPQDLPEKFRGAKRVSELMATPEGREAWDKFGTTFEGKFTITPDGSSYSEKTFNAYLAAKKQGIKAQARPAASRTNDTPTSGAGQAEKPMPPADKPKAFRHYADAPDHVRESHDKLLRVAKTFDEAIGREEKELAAARSDLHNSNYFQTAKKFHDPSYKGTPEEIAEVKAAHKKYNDACRRIEKNQKSLEFLREIKRVECVRSCYHPDGAAKNTVKAEHLAKATDKIKRGIEHFEHLVGPGANVDGGEVSLRMTKKTRAYADASKNRIVLAENDSDATAAHEMGHILESGSKRLQASLDFREKRRSRAGEEYRPLKAFVKGGDDEGGFKDDWIDPYTSKDYGKSATEVLSMGFTHFLEDPHGFALKDPEHFQFFLTQIRRRA